MLKSVSNRTATELVYETGEAKLLKKSNKMDFYDKHQKILSFNGMNKDDKSLILSFSAPSDISSYYFTLASQYKKEFTEIHENAIKNALSHFKKHLGLQGDFNFKNETSDTIFEKKGFSPIQYLYTITKISTYMEDGVPKEINRYNFIQNQTLIKNLYEFYLAQNIK